MSIFLKKSSDKPQKQPNLCCSKCGGKRIIQGEEVKAYGNPPASMVMEIPTGEKGLFGLNEKVDYAWVYANLCVDCGFIDWFMKKEDAEELWKVYTSNKDNNNKI